MIKLDSDFRLEPDQHSWTLVYEKLTGKNEETGKDIVSSWQTWHSNLTMALNAYIDACLKPANGVVELLGLLQKAMAVKARIIGKHADDRNRKKREKKEVEEDFDYPILPTDIVEDDF